MFISIVREAFVTSVMWIPPFTPPVRFYINWQVKHKFGSQDNTNNDLMGTETELGHYKGCVHKISKK